MFFTESMQPAAVLVFYILMLTGAAVLYYGRLNRPVFAGADRRDLLALLLIAGSYVLGAVDQTGLLVALGFLLTAKAFSLIRPEWPGLIRLLLYCLPGLAALALAIHLLPGFSRYLLVDEQVISTLAAQPFSLYLGVDKALAAAVLFMYLMPQQPQLLSTRWLLIVVSAPLLIILVALLLGVPADLKAGAYLWWFIPVNLLVTCLAEELFFRRWFQQGLINLLPAKPWAGLVCVLATSYVFLLAHGILLPDSETAFLYLLASLLYAGIYQLTRRVELAVVVHFSMNMSHILLLPYPLS